MNKLWTIVSAEYQLDIKSKSFWLTTLLIPLLILGLGIFIGYLSTESDAMQAFQETAPNAGKDLSGMQALGMMGGMFLTMFIIMYGAMIFNKVKAEKTNRIVEVLVSCVPGRAIMFAKVISVGLTGLTQILIWAAMIGGIATAILLIFPIGIDLSAMLDIRLFKAMLWTILFFIGGFSFYGGLFAMAGAVTDRNNENQGYLSFIMMILMVSFYIGIFAVDNTGTLSSVCLYLPFTSATVATVQAISGATPWYLILLSLLILYVSAAFALVMAGKIYTSAILLKGKKLSPRDILVFLKAK